MSLSRLNLPKDRWLLREDQQNPGCLRTQRGALPLDSIELRLILRGLQAQVQLRQTFVNVHQQSLEALYIFPLPVFAAVTAFRFTTSESTVEGQLLSRAEARWDYSRQVAVGQVSTLLEEERPEIFTMTVGNLPAQQSATVEMTLEVPLVCLDNQALFRFPLVVAPAYIPGTPLPGQDVGQGAASDTGRVPDASRVVPPTLLPGYPNPVLLTIEVEIDSPDLDPSRLRSTLPLELQQDGRLLYQPDTGRLDHDFVLAVPFEPAKPCASLLIQEDTLGDDGLRAFCLTLTPPTHLPKSRQPRDVLVLLDRSQSMDGWPISAAAQTVIRLREGLLPSDRFRLLTFADQVESHELDGPDWLPVESRGPGHLPCEESRRNLAEQLQRLPARGVSDIARALDEGLGCLSSGSDERERHLVLISDGQVGNESEIFTLWEQRGQGIVLSTLGISSSVNAGFLERLAARGGGLCQLASSQTQLRQCLPELARRITCPLLRDLSLEGAPLEKVTATCFDLYPGLITRIYGRLPADRHESLRLRATSADGSDYQQIVPLQRCHGSVEKLWARQRLLDMDYDFTVSAPQALAADAITAFSLKYGVLCRFTAWLASDPTLRVPPRAHTQVQPVSTPAGLKPADNERPHGGLIRVDLLPTEKRGFRTPPLIWLLLLPVIVPLYILFWLGRQLNGLLRKLRKTQQKLSDPTNPPPRT